MTQIVVARLGDAWIGAKYFKLRKGQKHIGSKFLAVYTERPVKTPYEC